MQNGSAHNRGRTGYAAAIPIVVQVSIRHATHRVSLPAHRVHQTYRIIRRIYRAVLPSQVYQRLPVVVVVVVVVVSHQHRLVVAAATVAVARRTVHRLPPMAVVARRNTRTTVSATEIKMHRVTRCSTTVQRTTRRPTHTGTTVGN
jgi:hypothetical protein